MSEPRVIAQRGGDLLVITDEAKRLGFVVGIDDEAGQKTWFPETTIDTILARGYWEPYEGALTVDEALHGATGSTGAARAVTQYEWADDAWTPVAVYLFTRTMVAGRACPGRPDIADWVESVRAGARWSPGQNLEDLATQMCERFSHEEYGNLYEEVEPAPTVDVLAYREFASLKPPTVATDPAGTPTSVGGLTWTPGGRHDQPQGDGEVVDQVSDLHPQSAGSSRLPPASDPTSGPMCPACGSSHAARYLYGEPAADRMLETRIRDGQVVLGGCVIRDDQPDFRCNECGFGFQGDSPASAGRTPLGFRAARSPDVADSPDSKAEVAQPDTVGSKEDPGNEVAAVSGADPTDRSRGGLDTDVKARSVADLIAQRLDEHDPWRLALVQRHLVWDEVRMAHLLDSLLAGYPIGSLLVCRVRQEAHVLRESGVTRVAEKARAGTWQLLDGQQRINALIALFTEHAPSGRFYLDMTQRRIPEEVVTRRRDARKALDYIAWRPDDAGGTGPLDRRERYIDLSRLQAWASLRTAEEILEQARTVAMEPATAIGILNEIDPAFADELPVDELDTAAKRVSQLLHAWAGRSIPVQYFTVEGPLDVLQVFSRINLAGVRLDGEDVFFAAVKTEWPNAEEHLDRVASASPLLNRMIALRLLARLASRAHSKEDLLPLRVDRLNGKKGRRLVSTMERLAADDSPVLARIGVLGRLLTTESAIGNGLRMVDDGLLDHVFGWAAVNPRADDEDAVRGHLASVESYLLGAHAFRYPSIFRDGFLRLGFAEAVAAGAAAGPFPVEPIIAGARRRWHRLRRGQNWVAAIDDDDQRRRLVDQNAGLFLSILQQVPYAMPDRDPDDPKRGPRQVEWDHIYPQAKANLMRVPHPTTNRRVNHADRGLVWNGGNLWALDRPINNFASDSFPSKKFDLLDTLPDATRDLPSSWPTTDDAAITLAERSDLLEAERHIVARDIDAAMPLFRSYVVSRGLRIFRTVLDRYPALELFAPSAAIDPDLFEEAPAADLWQHLGLAREGEQPEESELEMETPDVGVSDNRYAAVFALAERAHLASEVRAIIATATELGLAPRPHETSVMIAPHANRTRMLFTVWPQTSHGGRLSIYRWAPAIAEFFPEIEEALARDALGPDGYGILDREDVPAFLDRLRGLLSQATQSGGATTTSLTGEDIRGIAYEWLQAVDPEHNGQHYYEIAHATERHGTIAGKNTMAAVLKVIRRHPRLFHQVGPGTYTWVAVSLKPGADSSPAEPASGMATMSDG